jgi:hypothetical protein
MRRISSIAILESGRPGLLRCGVPHLDALTLHRVEHHQSRHDLASGEDLNSELVVGDLPNALGENFARAIQRIKRFRPARGEPPLDFRHGLRDGRLSNGNGAPTGDCA